MEPPAICQVGGFELFEPLGGNIIWVRFREHVRKTGKPCFFLSMCCTYIYIYIIHIYIYMCSFERCWSSVEQKYCLNAWIMLIRYKDFLGHFHFHGPCDFPLGMWSPSASGIWCCHNPGDLGDFCPTYNHGTFTNTYENSNQAWYCLNIMLQALCFMELYNPTGKFRLQPASPGMRPILQTVKKNLELESGRFETDTFAVDILGPVGQRSWWPLVLHRAWIYTAGDSLDHYFLVGGLEHDFLFFPSYWECHHPNWRTHIFHTNHFFSEGW